MKNSQIQMHITGLMFLIPILIGLGIGLFSIFTGGSKFDPSFFKTGNDQSQNQSTK